MTALGDTGGSAATITQILTGLGELAPNVIGSPLRCDLKQTRNLTRIGAHCRTKFYCHCFPINVGDTDTLWE